MTRDHVQIVDFPYPDDWWDDEKMLAPMDNMSDIMLQRDHKHDLAFCPLETALEKAVESFGVPSRHVLTRPEVTYPGPQKIDTAQVNSG